MGDLQPPRDEPGTKYSFEDIRHLVKCLKLPGISYDEYGVCLAPDAPEWVRGRIVRHVQIAVTDMEERGVISGFSNLDQIMELERLEKEHFGEAMWKRLYAIDNAHHHELTPTEKALMREFDVKMAARSAPDAQRHNVSNGQHQNAPNAQHQKDSNQSAKKAVSQKGNYKRTMSTQTFLQVHNVELKHSCLVSNYKYF